MKARLIVLTGAAVGREALVGEVAVLGRQQGCALVVEGESVSRQHARVFRRGDRYLVADLNSRNGTFVNGTKVTRQDLADGDEIGLGDQRVRFLLVGEQEPAPPAAQERSQPREPAPAPPPGAQGAAHAPAVPAADPEVLVVPRSAPRDPAPRAGPPPPAGEVRTRQRLLQFHRRPDHRNLLLEDLSQRGPLFRFAVVLAVLALCAAAFFVVQGLVAGPGG